MASRRPKFQTAYYAASGHSANDCLFLGQRFPENEDFSPNHGESWVLAAEPDGEDDATIRLIQGSPRRLNGIWRSPTGRAIVVDHTGHARNAGPFVPGVPFTWEEHDLQTSLLGVWGIDDRFALAWGMRRLHDWTMHRWDGTRWNAVESPDFFVHAVHGSSPEDVWAVGWDGRTARWDGHHWRPFSTPVREALVSVYVESDDEMYAVGIDGSLLEGSSHGWALVGRGPGPLGLHAVAKWRGELWIGAGAGGLCRRVGTTSEIEVVKPNVWAMSFDARWDLVIVTQSEIVGTADGSSFIGFGLDSLAELRAGAGLMEW